MQVFELKGEVRSDVGKKATKALRVNNRVPCVLYGGEGNIHFSTAEGNLRKLLYTPNVYLIKLNLNGEIHNAVMREIQFHPVTDRPLHIDFYRIYEDKPVVLEVPVRTEGFAVGVRAGGKLSVISRKLKVKALPKDMPDYLTVNVENLVLGKAIKVRDLKVDGIEIVNAPSVVIAQVKLTRAAKAAGQEDEGEEVKEEGGEEKKGEESEE